MELYIWIGLALSAAWSALVLLWVYALKPMILRIQDRRAMRLLAEEEYERYLQSLAAVTNWDGPDFTRR